MPPDRRRQVPYSSRSRPAEPNARLDVPLTHPPKAPHVRIPYCGDRKNRALHLARNRIDRSLAGNGMSIGCQRYEDRERGENAKWQLQKYPDLQEREMKIKVRTGSGGPVTAVLDVDEDETVRDFVKECAAMSSSSTVNSKESGKHRPAAEMFFDDKGFEVIWEDSGWRRKDHLAARAMSTSGSNVSNTSTQSSNIPLFWPLATAAFAFKK